MTKLEHLRLAEIRMHLEKFRALGHDVSTWNDTFFLEILDKADRA